ncbi:hypothetical protein B0H15DRAFT_947177 [Mycena belliarum]|uniref:F-box domain-containing protein n=1 Tax=Mycena belliarum TaxID=1033014 RepID=A0AAD6U7E3_9AGAR|nr:hypothetical protein B0H15DRAFT_947177 [Mycena belliae]
MASSSELPLCHSCNNTFTESFTFPNPEELLAIVGSNPRHHPTSWVRAIIDEAPAEISRYDGILGDFQLVVGAMTARRDALKQLYERCTHVEGPVGRLPNELLALIFDLTAKEKSPTSEPVDPEEWEDEANEELSSIAGGTLFVCGQVCSRWRSVAMNTPLLWTNISLDMRCWTLPVETIRASVRHQQMIQLLKARLERTEQLPLTVQVCGMGACQPQALHILAQTSPRWRAASFSLDCTMFINLAAITGKLPNLEVLALHFLDESDEIEDIVVVMPDETKYFVDAPRLRQLEFCGAAAAVVPLPLQQLECCGISGIEGEDLSDLLTIMSTLPIDGKLHTEINLSAVRADLPLALVPTVSPVSDFEIESQLDDEDDSLLALEELFSALTLPRMSRLALFGMLVPKTYSPLLWPHSAACAMLKRSGSCTMLRALCIQDVVITEAELLELFPLVPALEFLALSDHPSSVIALASVRSDNVVITDRLLKALTPATDDTSSYPWFLPRLECADFRTLGQFSDQVLEDFVGDRLIFRDNKGFACAFLWLPGYPYHLRDETLELFEGWTEDEKLEFECREFDHIEDQ